MNIEIKKNYENYNSDDKIDGEIPSPAKFSNTSGREVLDICQ